MLMITAQILVSLWAVCDNFEITEDLVDISSLQGSKTWRESNEVYRPDTEFPTE
jgi:hypothetical protein